MEIPDKILIVGLGATGIATAKFLGKMGKKVAITDTKTEEELAPALKELSDVEFEGRFGGHKREYFLGFPMIVASPGVDTNMPYLQEARKEGAKVIGEIEFASTFVGEPIIAITGTNGKTTVTSLIGEIFKRAFGDVFVGGNIGNPLINYVSEGKRAKYAILEISSFQLETIETFHPNTSVLLNVTEDHLDRYRSYDEYKAAKYRVFENQQETDWAVLNKDLPSEVETKAKTFYFKNNTILKEGAFFFNDFMFVRMKGKEWTYKRSLSPLVGIHNTENILAALLVSHIYDIDRGAIEETLRSFKGLSHRVEFVKELRGVRFYNDSKATNVDAAKRALESMEGKVVLIAGGKDKGGSYKVIEPLMKNVRAMVLIGEAKQRIFDEIGRLTETHMENDLGTAARKALGLAKEGDAVLFSPMCSSYDMFKDYKERGNTFKMMVESL